MSTRSQKSAEVLEATVTSKGQVTLPSGLRKRLGLHKGSRVRFTIPANGEVTINPVRHSIDDLWKIVDSYGPAKRVMSFEEMNAAKVRQKS